MSHPAREKELGIYIHWTTLNFEFRVCFFFKTGCIIKNKEHSLPNRLNIVERERKIHAFLKSINVKWSANNFVYYSNVDFFLKRTYA